MAKMRDRLSIHLENGQDEIREAVTVLRNGGTASQSGLVGITNAAYDPLADCLSGVKMPETIFNVQATGDCNIRFSSGPAKAYRSSIEILGNGNDRASGLHITYDPMLDDAFIVGDVCVNPSAVDNTVVDFSLIRPSGTEGIEFSHISMSERGYVAIGMTRAGSNRKYHPNAPLTVSYDCDFYSDSGTISQREQQGDPETTENFGKIYVKPYTVGGRSQALYFIDDSGNVTNLVLSQDLDPSITTDGLIYGYTGNTYGGHYTPQERAVQTNTRYYTYYGWGAGNLLYGTNSTIECNTLIGYHAGSGLTPDAFGNDNNTVVGCKSLEGYRNARRNVIIGDGNVSNGGGATGGIDDCIIIGRNLYDDSLPADGRLAIGMDNPVIKGKIIGSNKSVSIVEATFDVSTEGSNSLKISDQFDGLFSRYINIIDIIDYSKGGVSYGENSLKFNFSNEDALSMTLFQIDPRGGPLSNSPSYQAPPSTTPFAELQADFKLQGAIRFQDGTSMSGLSYFELLTSKGTSGVNKIYQGANNTNYFVLDFSELQLAGNLSSGITTANTFIAVQLEGTNSPLTGKMSLQGLSDYVSSGTSSIAENCNVLISNPENELLVNTAANSRTVMIGCDVATQATGWKNSVIIGADAGANATTPNGGLATDTAAIFIGYQAGYDCDTVDNVVAIGTNAGKSAKSSSDSIFIGSNAGLDVTYSESIGIGENALRGRSGQDDIGAGNIEIVCSKLDNQRLFHSVGSISDRLNIQNTIAGRTDYRNISIGDARLSPTAPLEVRRDSIIHTNNPNNYIQAWYCDDVLVASLDCNGIFTSDTSQAFIEGTMDEPLPAAASIASPASGLMSVYVNGVDTGDNVYITNRDATLSATTSTYVVAIRMGSEYRPAWVGC